MSTASAAAAIACVWLWLAVLPDALPGRWPELLSSCVGRGVDRLLMRMLWSSSTVAEHSCKAAWHLCDFSPNACTSLHGCLRCELYR